REAARRILKLPQGACLIGTAGGLSAMKGVGLIYEAWPRIAEECPSAHLVLAGPIEPSLPIPDGPRVHYLVELPSSSVARLSSSRQPARRILQLPQGACLIGTAGGLSAMKGVGLIYEAWPRIAEECPSAHLVLAGPIEPSLPIPDGPRVHYLGELPSSSVAELF